MALKDRFADVKKQAESFADEKVKKLVEAQANISEGVTRFTKTELDEIRKRYEKARKKAKDVDLDQLQNIAKQQFDALESTVGELIDSAREKVGLADNKKPLSKKSASKKTSAPKTAAKTSVAKKATAKKATAKKPAPKKAAPKKATAKKPSAKKTTVKKGTVSKVAPKKVTAKKTTAAKAPAKKATAKKAAPKK